MHRVRVERDAHGYRLVAAQAIGTGERILTLEGVRWDRPGRFTVQIAPEEHLAPPPELSPEQAVVHHPWIVTNHSCDPCALLRGRDLVARVPLLPGDEITFDYETTERDMAEPFSCRCGSARCRGIIRGFGHREDFRP